ncbi:hypothetical protein AN9043.2 [Aspergillus nidulans FGSC A4]|nr:hypothetical protein AN9043.2 [Aspergillus nidulans FGSC A4]|eukprot:XP_682312.1 hypothetical protein AN9043.2 [Aspergillus nidulans FGSC A4]
MAQSGHDHIPRVSFPSDEQLLAWSETECPWPAPLSRSSARLSGFEWPRPLLPHRQAQFDPARAGQRLSRRLAQKQTLGSVCDSLAGSAIRLAIIMGLNPNIPESQLSDAGEREHRERIFRTAYTFDRMWTAKLDYPCTISDDEIEAFSDLRRWLEDLPSSLRLPTCSEGDWDPKARCLHHLFNQLDKRLLSGLRFFLHPVSILSYYRLSNFHLTPRKDRQSDEEQFEVAVSFLVQLQGNGNYAAAEFHKHIEATTDLMHSTKVRLGVQSASENATAPQDSAYNSILDAAITECRLHPRMCHSGRRSSIISCKGSWNSPLSTWNSLIRLYTWMTSRGFTGQMNAPKCYHMSIGRGQVGHMRHLAYMYQVYQGIPCATGLIYITSAAIPETALIPNLRTEVVDSVIKDDRTACLFPRTDNDGRWTKPQSSA